MFQSVGCRPMHSLPAKKIITNKPHALEQATPNMIKPLVGQGCMYISTVCHTCYHLVAVSVGTP